MLVYQRVPDLAKLKKCDSETKKHLARQHNFGNFAQDVAPYVFRADKGQNPTSTEPLPQMLLSFIQPSMANLRYPAKN